MGASVYQILVTTAIQYKTRNLNLKEHGVEWTGQLDRSPSSKFILNVYNFQQRMSWLPQRWRTQRNAIRNANCRTSWIIKILNAHCASRICLVACKTECPCTPLDCCAFVCINMSEYDIAMGQPRLYWNFLSLTAKINTTPPLVLSFSCACVEGLKPGSMCTLHVYISVDAFLYLLHQRTRMATLWGEDQPYGWYSTYPVTGSQFCKSTRWI